MEINQAVASVFQSAFFAFFIAVVGKFRNKKRQFLAAGRKDDYVSGCLSRAGVLGEILHSLLSHNFGPYGFHRAALVPDHPDNHGDQGSRPDQSYQQGGKGSAYL